MGGKKKKNGRRDAETGEGRRGGHSRNRPDQTFNLLTRKKKKTTT